MPTLSNLLAQIGNFFTNAFSWLDTVLDTVTGNPALLIMVIAIPVSGVAIGYLKRLLSL